MRVADPFPNRAPLSEGKELTRRWQTLAVPGETTMSALDSSESVALASPALIRFVEMLGELRDPKVCDRIGEKPLPSGMPQEARACYQWLAEVAKALLGDVPKAQIRRAWFGPPAPRSTEPAHNSESTGRDPRSLSDIYTGPRGPKGAGNES